LYFVVYLIYSLHLIDASNALAAVATLDVKGGHHTRAALCSLHSLTALHHSHVDSGGAIAHSVAVAAFYHCGYSVCCISLLRTGMSLVAPGSIALVLLAAVRSDLVSPIPSASYTQ
jgi:hypothetical protein